MRRMENRKPLTFIESIEIAEALSPEQAAVVIGVSESTLYAMDDPPDSYWVGRRRYFRKASLRRWVKLREKGERDEIIKRIEALERRAEESTSLNIQAMCLPCLESLLASVRQEIARRLQASRFADKN